MRLRLLIGPLLMVLPWGAGAAPLTLDLPQPAAQTVAPQTQVGDLLLPSGPWTAAGIPGDRLAGRVSQSAWRVEQPLATVDLMTRLTANVVAAGFQPIFDCATEACGGFDFRYAITVLPEPDMHVDLGDFRFLSARRGDEGVTLLVSRSAQAAYVQITTVGPQPAAPAAQAAATAAAGVDATASTGDGTAPEPAPESAPAAAPVPPADPSDPGAVLLAEGRLALDDLAFASGKGALEPGDYASLTALAGWLTAHPDMRVALVGHTDATGGLQGNMALSRARAQSVRAALIALGVPAAQMDAEGMGYLSPRASNLTEEGRQKNRRVEVVLTSTQLPSATSEN